MSATDHHGADDEFAERCELAAQGGHNTWMAETQTDVSAKMGLMVDKRSGREGERTKRTRLRRRWGKQRRP